MVILFLTFEENLHIIQPNNYDKQTYSGKCVELRIFPASCKRVYIYINMDVWWFLEECQSVVAYKLQSSWIPKHNSGLKQRAVVLKEETSLGWPFLNSWYLDRIHVCLCANINLLWPRGWVSLQFTRFQQLEWRKNKHRAQNLTFETIDMAIIIIMSTSGDVYIKFHCSRETIWCEADSNFQTRPHDSKAWGLKMSEIRAGGFDPFEKY